MSKPRAYTGYEITGLAVELREHLDPVILDRLLHEGPVTEAEGQRIIGMLREFRKSLPAGAV